MQNINHQVKGLGLFQTPTAEAKQDRNRAAAKPRRAVLQEIGESGDFSETRVIMPFSNPNDRASDFSDPLAFTPPLP